MSELREDIDQAADNFWSDEETMAECSGLHWRSNMDFVQLTVA